MEKRRAEYVASITVPQWYCAVTCQALQWVCAEYTAWQTWIASLQCGVFIEPARTWSNAWFGGVQGKIARWALEGSTTDATWICIGDDREGRAAGQAAAWVKIKVGITNYTVFWVGALRTRLRAFVASMVGDVVIIGIDTLIDASPIHGVPK